MPLRRSPDVTYEVVDDRAMLLDPSGRELITLNPVGSVVWETLDGTLDVAGITDRLLPRFDGIDARRARARRGAVRRRAPCERPDRGRGAAT